MLLVPGEGTICGLSGVGFPIAYLGVVGLSGDRLLDYRTVGPWVGIRSSQVGLLATDGTLPREPDSSSMVIRRVNRRLPLAAAGEAGPVTCVTSRET